VKVIIASIVGVLVVGGLVAALIFFPNKPQSNVSTPAPETSDEQTEQETTQPGRYLAYDQGAISTEGYSETVLFFYASWCPECRAFDEAITANTVPYGTQILKVDYDSSTDLRQRYGVTLQSTFVKVDDEGNLISKWVGYGQDKSIDVILEQT
jgi:hypothetical protein